MGKGKENKEQRIDKRKSFPRENVERIVVITKNANVSVQLTRADIVQTWIHGKSSQEVILEMERRKKELIIMFDEKEAGGNVKLKIAIPTSIKYLSIGTSSGNVRIKEVLPEELRIKTKKGDVRIDDVPEKECEISVSTRSGNIKTEFESGYVELEAKSKMGKIYNYYKGKGEATIKLNASTTYGDIIVS